MSQEQERSKIEATLRQFWEQNAISTGTDESQATDDMLVPLDSITACEVLLDIEKLLGKKLPVESIVKKGGYTSKDEFVSRITDAVLKHAKELP